MAFDRPLHGDEVPETPPAALPPSRRPWTARSRSLLGMPQLDASGLSELWLQKTCGERHWRGLAASLGQLPQSWIDGQGRRVYAAFGLLRLQGAELWRAREGDDLTLSSTLSRVGRAQAWSRHRLHSAGRALGQLEMLSVFVSREDGVSNRSVRRVGLEPAACGAPPAAARALADLARAWRSELTASTPICAAAGAPAPMQFLPCPRADFNGAGLLYFPSFTAFADRALWAWGRLGPQDRVQQRECLFLGNVELGEPVLVSLANEQISNDKRTVMLHIASANRHHLVGAVRVHIWTRAT